MNMDTVFSFFYLYTYLIIYKTMIFDREVLRSVEATRGRATKSHTKKPSAKPEIWAQSIFPVHGRRYSVGTPLPSRGGAMMSLSGHHLQEGRGGVCIFFTDKKLETPPLPRLRPTVASLPNCSPLAIALKGGERLRLHAPEITTDP